MRVVLGLIPLTLGVALSFCSSDEDDSCQPGSQSACSCESGQKGVRTCFVGGTGYGKCDCSGGKSDASSGGAGGGASGAGGSGASTGGATSGGGSGGGSSGASGSGGAAGVGGGPSDAAIDAPTSCPAGSVSNAAAGSCDLVAQNCSSPFTCSIQQAGATWKTECVTLGAGTKALGQQCASHDECAPKLRCTLGKCTRPCCIELEDQLCGTSGQCDMEINFGGGAATLRVCTFSPPCTPWANDCPAGQPESDCHITGTEFFCTFPNYAADAGSTLGKPCTYINDCGDSQHCIYSSGDAATGTCRWLCKASNTGAPDAGTVGGAPGKGGCASGQTCVAFGNPSWLGFCNP